MLKASAGLQWARCAGSRPVHGVVEARSRTTGYIYSMPEIRGSTLETFGSRQAESPEIIVLRSRAKSNAEGGVQKLSPK